MNYFNIFLLFYFLFSINELEFIDQNYVLNVVIFYIDL